MTHTPDASKPAPPWAELSDEELFAWRIRDLELSIADTELELRIEQLWQELGARGITFLPSCYLGDEWFCPDGVPVIAIPFYLAHPRLKQLEQKMMLEVEGGTKETCMRLLRHEAGHAINYAYLLHRRPAWRKVFGSFSEEYPDTYRPLPYSKRFVRHLENWYAQYHPDEDFAETFAVWLDPDSNWRERYTGWKALAKLEFVDDLMGRIAGRDPKVTGGQRICDASKLAQKLGTYYARKRRAYAEDMPDFYDSDLRRIFGDVGEEKSSESTVHFLRRHRKAVVDTVSRWTGENKFMVNRLLRNITKRCGEIGLARCDDEAQTLTQITAYLTYMVMNYLFTGKLKRHP